MTATNVLFLLDDPERALNEWRRVLAPAGELCLLNPSENLSVAVARQLADERGLGRTPPANSLLNWAHNAESHFRWTEDETRDLLTRAGLRLDEIGAAGWSVASPGSPAQGFIDTSSLWGIIPGAAP